MKKTTAILCVVILCIMLAACAQKDREASYYEETVSETEWNGGAPQNILNTDFRNMLWNMTPNEIECQEQRYADCFGDYFFFYDNIDFAGFDSRLYYYFEDNWQCTSAAYMISLSEDDPYFNTAYGIADKYLTGLFAPPDEEGGSIRTTKNAVIEISETVAAAERIIYVKFSKPNDYNDEKYFSKIVYY